MKELKELIKKGKPYYIYYDDEGYLLLSYKDENGIEYLSDNKIFISEVENGCDAAWIEKCKELLKDIGIDCELHSIESFYEVFLCNFYSGNDNILMMSAEEQKELYNKIKEYENSIKENPNNRELILEAIKTCEYVLEFISGELKNDKNFALEVSKNSKLGLCFLGPLIHIDKEFALEIVNNNGINIATLSEELKNDKDIAIVALKNDKNAFKYIGKELKNDKKFIDKIKNEGIYLD